MKDTLPEAVSQNAEPNPQRFITYEEAIAAGETRKWSELSEPERIDFEVANILENPTWVNNFPLYVVRPYRIVPVDPVGQAQQEWWINFQKFYKDIDACIEKLGFNPEEVDSYRFDIGGDPIYDELMLNFGASIYREMRLLGYEEKRLRS